MAPAGCYDRFSLRTLGPLSARTFRGLLVQSEFPLRVLLAPCPGIGSRQAIVPRRILGLKFDGHLQRRNRGRVVLFGHQRCAQSEVSIGKVWIQLGRFAEVLDGGVEIPGLPRQLSQDVLRSGIVWIDLQLLLQLFLCLPL